MAMQGKVIKWNDERGFGFIQQNGQTAELFTHISDVSPRGVRPAVGDIVTFDVKDTGAKGLKAVSVKFVGDKGFERARKKPATFKAREERPSYVGRFLILGVVLLAGVFAYQKHFASSGTASLKQTLGAELPIQSKSSTNSQQFTCQNKSKCSEMSSCEEATFYLNHCPGTIMDGDGDGLPCEEQWCGH